MKAGRGRSGLAGWRDGLADAAGLRLAVLPRLLRRAADSMTAPDGTPVNAVRGLLDMIARLVRARQPGRLVACLDADWRPAFRVAAIPSYKAHRANPDGTEQVPDALTAQIPLIERGAGRGRGGHGRRAAGTRRTTSSARWRPAPTARSRWSPATGTCSSSSTTPARIRVAYIARGHGQARGRGRGGGGRAIPDPRPGLRGVRRAARRPERRPARRAGRRGEDRGRAGPGVRQRRGDAGGDGRRVTAASRWAAGRSWSRRATTWRPRCPSSAWRPTRRCRRWTGGCRSRPPIPGRLAELDERWDLGIVAGPDVRRAGRAPGLTGGAGTAATAACRPEQDRHAGGPGGRPRAAQLQHLQGHQAGVVLRVGGAERPQRGGDGLLRVAMPRTAADSVARPSSMDRSRRSTSPSL